MDPFDPHGGRTTTTTTTQSPAHGEPVVQEKAKKSLSRIDNMTVGDVRQCFSQMRAAAHLTSSTILWCGMSAGDFALQYLISTVGTSRKKRTAKKKDA